MKRGGVIRGLCTLQILCMLSVVNGQCAKFEFPTISDTFKATRNATVTVPFILNTEDCGDNLDRNFSIAVAKKKERSGGIFTDLCKILVDDSGSCVPFREKVCTCENEKGRYSLTKTVDLSDETLWRWKTSNGNIASDRKIQFVVEYPPRITRLSLLATGDNDPLTQAVKPNTSVDILCNYEQGKPHSAPFLLNAERVRFDVEQGEGEGEIKHVLPEVTCDDVGIISCEAPGAFENKTARLLVECPPRFTEKIVKHFVVSAEQPTELTFKVQAHTHTITSCRVTKYPSSQQDDVGELPVEHRLNRECPSNVSLFGSPPYLTLKMSLSQLTSQDVGKWELTIANDLGSDDVSFWLNITGLPDPDQKRVSTILPEMSFTDESPQAPSTNSFASEDKAGEGSVSDIIIGVVSSLALLLLIATVVVIVLLVKRSRQLRRLRRPPGRQIPDRIREVDCTVPSSHMYDEPEPARQPPTRGTDQRESDKKDYLHAVCFMPPMYPGLDDPPPPRSPRLLAGESELQPLSLSPQYIGM